MRAFEVASVKLHDGPRRDIGVQTSGLRLTARALNLRGLIMWTYDVKNFQVSGSARLLHVSGRNYEATNPKGNMAGLTEMIENTGFLDRPVVDRTGLQGTYDIDLTYTPGNRANRADEADPGDVGIFQAVEEQLGLKLNPQKGIVEVLVVDRAEKPSAN